VDVTRREMVEAELDRLIAKRHDRRMAGKGARPALEAWMESERRHDTRRREEGRREAIVDSLCPEGGMERVLAERVALCSWRLNRVVLYESERVSELQEGVVESVRDRRKRRLEVERLLAKSGEKVLTDLGILIEAHPNNALEDAKMARLTCKTVEKLFDAPADAVVKGPDASVVLALAAERAVRQAAY
jgi:hypothetical protein